LNRDMCKFESSQKDESRWQSTDSSKACRNTSASKCPGKCDQQVCILFRNTHHTVFRPSKRVCHCPGMYWAVPSKV